MYPYGRPNHERPVILEYPPRLTNSGGYATAGAKYMTDTIEVGRRYRNPTGEYEILSIDGIWASVRYEDGTTKRHLLAALQIHWENDQAGAQAAAAVAQKNVKAPSRQRPPKAPPPFPVDQTSALIAEIICSLADDGGTYVPRQAIVEALMADPRGKQLVEAAHKNLFYRTPEWIAGSMLDQFGKDLNRKGSPTRDRFDREQIDNVWAYRPRA